MRIRPFLSAVIALVTSLGILLQLLSPLPARADPYPPYWTAGTGAAIHHAPAPWPTEPANAADCGSSCGQWKPYTRYQNSIDDPRNQDPSNGGTAPQNYVNVSSSCTDKTLPSIYYYLHQGAAPEQDVIMFRWRVEQIANTYATGPSAGTYGASQPWNSALWTVLFDIDGSGYRSLAAHLNGSSGSPAAPIDNLAGIWSDSPTQSIDYINDPSVHLLGHNPTAFVDDGTGRILNFQNSLNPTPDWPNGAAETTWDYGTTRARQVITQPCNEYFIDYQIPVAMLDASGLTGSDGKAGPKITRSTPISMMFCTANSLTNPFQKDCAINKTWTADASRPAPFGDYISFDKDQPYSQPIVSSVTATAPAACGQDYTLTAKVQDTLAVINGAVVPSVKAVDFYYWYDANGSGYADDVGGSWVHAATGTRVSGTLNTWTAHWDANSLPKGRYLIGVQAVDDNTLVDDGMTPSGVDNRTFSYVAGDAQNRIYIGGAWIAGQEAQFPAHSPAQIPSASENWYGNPAVTGIQTALVGVAVNTCGVAPTLTLSAGSASVLIGQPDTFTLTVSNPATNPNAVTLTQLQTVLPAGFSYQAGSTTGVFGTTDATSSGQTLTWTGNTSLAPGASVMLNFSATAASVTGTYSMTATGATSFGAITSDPVQIGVGAARLSIAMTPSAYSAVPGDTLTYTLTYSNDSPVNASGIVLTATLPTGLTYAPSSCSGGCSYDAGTRTLTWTVGALASGQGPDTVTYETTVDNPYAGAATNQSSASIDSNETNPATATASVFVATPLPQLTLSKTANKTLVDPAGVAPANQVTFTLSYANTGNAAATNVVLSDPLPSGFTFVSATGSPSATPGVGVNGTVTWSFASLAAGASGSVTVTAQVDNPYTGTNNPATNTASISSTEITTAVSDGASVGVLQSGQACSTYYYHNQTTNVRTGGPVDNERIATTDAPTSGTASTVSINVTTTPVEAVRFYQDPANANQTTFSGNLTTNFYITKPSGPQLKMDVSVSDFDPSTGTSTTLGSASFTQTGSGTNQLFSFVTPLSGTLAKNHRLLWIFKAYSNNNSTFTLNFDGTGSQSSAQYCVTPPANLTLDKSVNSASVNVTGSGRTLTYTLNYSNTSSATNATNAVLSDVLPAGTTYASSSPAATTNPGVGNNGTVTWNLGTVTAGTSGSATVTVNVADDLTGTTSLDNSATLQSDQTAQTSAAASTTVAGAVSNPSGSPNVLLSLQASKTLLIPGDSVTYTLTAVNAGDKTATNVQVSDTLPASAWFSYVASSITGGDSRSDAGNPLTWTINSLAPGASATLTFQMRVANDGSAPDGVTTADNSATTSYSGGGTGSAVSNTVTVSVSTNANLSLSKTASTPIAPATDFAPGDDIEYSLTLTNNGSSAASGVTIYDPIPAHTSFQSITSGTGSFDTVNNRVIFTIDTLAAGASATLKFKATVLDTLSSGDTTVSNTATVSAGNTASHSASVSSTATAAPDMLLTLSAPASAPLPAATLSATASNTTTLLVGSSVLLVVGDYVRVNGTIARILDIAGGTVTLDTPITASSGAPVLASVTYSLTYQNVGDATADSAAISYPLPAGWLYVASSPAADSAPTQGDNGTLSWTLGSVAAGAGGTVQVTAIPTASGSAAHAATLTAAGGISVPASATTLVGGLTVSKTTSTAATTAGGTASYTITISNSLAAAVTGVQVTDLLPPGFTYSSGNPAPTSYQGGDLSRPIWSVDVPADGSTTIQLTAAIDASVGPATYQNDLAVTAPDGVGVTPFDPLASSAEDVTVLLNSGLLAGYVYKNAGSGNVPVAGVLLNIYDHNNALAHTAYTDSSGHYQQVLGAGDWRVEIGSVTANNALLGGLTAVGDPASLTIASGDTATRSFVFTAGTTTEQHDVARGGEYPFTKPSGSTLTLFSVTHGGVQTDTNNPAPDIYADVLTCSGDNCQFTATRSGRYELTFINSDGASLILVFTVNPSASFATAQQTGTQGTPVTVRVLLDDQPINAEADVPFSVSGENLASDPNPSDLFSRDPRVLRFIVGTNANVSCLSSGACYQDWVFTPNASVGTVQFTLLDGTGLDGAVLGSPITHTVNLATSTQTPLHGDLQIQPGNTVVIGTAVTVTVINLPATGHFGFAWDQSDNALGIGAQQTQSVNFTAPNTPGVYAIHVTVSDVDDSSRLPIPLDTWLRVIAPSDAVSYCGTGGDCSDDGNGIPIARQDPVCSLGVNDTAAVPYQLQIAEDNPYTSGLCLETTPGYGLRLGTVSFLAAPTYGAGVSGTAISNFGNDGQQALNTADPGYTHIGLNYDFEVTRLDSAGQSVNVVVPLPRNVQIPAGAVWRKFHPVNGWFTFVGDGGDALYSALRSADACPSPNSGLWVQGLVTGYDCVRLTLQDGGPDDLDGQANGIIRDPGTLAVPVASGGGYKIISGGGGGVGPWSLLIMSLILLWRRRAIQCGLLLMLMMIFAPHADSAPTQASDWYAGGIGAIAIGESGSSDVTRDLQAHGIDATARVEHLTRPAWRLFGGYRLNERLSLEAGYTDLGEVTTFVTGTPVDLRAIRGVPPASGRGVEAAIAGYLPIAARFDLYGRLGAWYWKARYHVDETGQTIRPSGGLDGLFGVGARYRINDTWQTGLGWDRYRIDNETVDFIGLGLIYRFGGAKSPGS